MQINTKIQIVLDQHDIEAAITAAIYQKLPHLVGAELSIKLIAGRGESGHRAEIEAIQEANEAVTVAIEEGVAPSTEESEPPFAVEASAGDVADAEERTETQEPETVAPARPVFRRNGVEATADPEAKEPDDAAATTTPAAPAKAGGLFKTLKRPDNRQ